MDNIIHTINKLEIDRKLAEINNYHPSLKFILEKKENGALPFLKMKILYTGKSRHLHLT